MYPSTLPIASVRISARPKSANRAASHFERAASPNGGAGMATDSACQSMSVLGLLWIQAKAA